jgi:hypothetical protein
MVRSNYQPMTIQELVTRLTTNDVYGPGNSIEISSDFQRGDEENGVWSSTKNKNFIDSIQKQYPFGLLTFVKDHESVLSNTAPWKVLDGGNRCRAIRDFSQNKITNTSGFSFTDLTTQEQALFTTKNIACEFVTIENSDPPETISDMFNKLNTTGDLLRQGELIKAHGWRKNVHDIELAKAIIGDPWQSDYISNQPDIRDALLTIRERWVESFGSLGETKRCDGLKTMTAYIIAIKEQNISYFMQQKYKKLLPQFSQDDPDHFINNVIPRVIQTLHDFLDFMDELPIKNSAIFGHPTKGFLSPPKISHLLYLVLQNKLTSDLRATIIRYYNSLNRNPEMFIPYELHLPKSGYMGEQELLQFIDFIERSSSF